jgi:hypothetical protein
MSPFLSARSPRKSPRLAGDPAPAR